MKKRTIIIAVLMLCLVAVGAFANPSDPVAPTTEETAKVEVAKASEGADIAKYIAAGIAVVIGCIAGGMAVGKIGAAAMGAMAENPELSGKALPFVGLAEGICLWGFLVALLIIIL